MTDLLKVSGLTHSFGGLVVASDISLALTPGDRVGLIGPNGAGKTTLVNLITGALTPTSGRVELGGIDITGLSKVDRVRLGLVRAFQVSRLFRHMTVREHLALAILLRDGKAGSVIADPWSIKPVAEEGSAILEELGLSEVAAECVAQIAYGQQRLLELAIAIALRPKVLMLDEPAAGVAHSETPRIMQALDRLPREIAVLMIEHDIDLVFRFATRIIVLAAGRIICEGPPSVVANDHRVREVYLGSYAHGRRPA